jgi:glutathione S-transferase
MYELYIANKNYSSWSLRAWLLMRELDVPFTEHLVRFGDSSAWQRFGTLSPSGKVPCLMDGRIRIWDSLAIAEYLAERHAAVWPAARVARAFARSAAAEMHSGFTELRNRCPMSCGVRIRLHDTSTALLRELARIESLWSDGISEFGGPFLAGASFTAVDAFFAPVAFRVQTYGLPLKFVGSAYVAHLLSLSALREWYADAVQESFRDEPHEEEIARIGDLTEDLRAQ